MDINHWNMELERLSTFFRETALPKTIILGGFMKVNDTRLFVNACLSGASNIEGNLVWNGNLHRLQMLEKAILVQAATG